MANYGNRIKGGQKLTGPRKKPTAAGRRRLEKGIKTVLKGVKKGAPVVRAVANPSGIPTRVVNRLTRPLQEKAARGAGKLIKKVVNRSRGFSPKAAPKRKTAPVGSRSMRRTRR